MAPDVPDGPPPASGGPAAGRSGERRPWATVEDRAGEEAFTHRRSPGRRRPRRRLWVIAVVIAVLALAGGLAAGYARGYFSSGKVGGPVTVVIPKGASLSEIAGDLQRAGVVHHAEAFVLKADGDGYGSRLQPGTYRLRRNEPYASLVAALLKGTAPATLKVSIPEGSTLKQEAVIAAAKVPTITVAKYLKVTSVQPLPFQLQGYRPGTTLEGVLFPATYDVAPGTTATKLVNKQLAAFDSYFAGVDLAQAGKANLTAYDVVIIASMIDREVLVPAERPLVAAVIWNRLKKRMPLQIDATVLYALGVNKPVVTLQDLKVDSPYNTYKHTGLPPTPISNPGLAALKAAAAPAAVDYLYYVARNDGTGRHYFTSSYEQFLVDQAKAKANGQ